DEMGLWTLNNVNPSTVWFPSNTVARFSNFQYIWQPAVSLISKGQWVAHSRLVLVERVKALSFANVNGGSAWETALDWGYGSAVMAYGRDDSHSPNTGVVVGGECVETTPGSVLTTANYLGQWLYASIVLDGSSQTMYFSLYDSGGHQIGQTSSRGLCGTSFGTNPARVLFFTQFGSADLDWVVLFSY